MSNALREKLKNALDNEHEAHAGLVLSRYLKVPVKQQGHDDAEPGQGKGSRRELFDSARSACRNVHDIYKYAFAARQSRLSHLKAIEFTGSIQTHLAVGMGTASPIEVGLRLHHTYGVPIIPGSALKGICAQAWRALSEDSSGDEKSRLVWEVVFGKTENDRPETAGAITFHDAWIDPCSLQHCLCDDVMTPHHRDYYGGERRGNDRVPPTDFDSPVPITFLSVQGTMHFALSCVQCDQARKKWLEYAAKLLQFALAHLGVGAKTTSGYGRFTMFAPEFRDSANDTQHGAET